jgi:hypothetical protein
MCKPSRALTGKDGREQHRAWGECRLCPAGSADWGWDPTLYVPRQGSAVALSADGNTALIGGPGGVYDTGATWVFTGTNGVWQQEQVLIGREVGPFNTT